MQKKLGIYFTWTNGIGMDVCIVLKDDFVLERMTASGRMTVYFYVCNVELSLINEKSAFTPSRPFTKNVLYAAGA